MALRYWVGGTGTWDNISTANWSATSGGAPGASAPSAADVPIFDANSGTGTVTLGDNIVCIVVQAFDVTAGNPIDLDFNGFTIELTANNNALWNTAPAFTVVPGGTIVLSYSGSVGTRFIITNAGSATNHVNVNVTAGSDQVQIGNFVGGIDFTGFTGTFTNTARSIYGGLKASSGMTFAAGAQITYFRGQAGPYIIESAGQTFDFPIEFDDIGGSWVLADNFALGSTRTLTLVNGTLDANGKNVSLGSFALGSGTKTLTLSSGTWTIAGSGTAWDANSNVTGLTVSASTGTINMNSASAKTFAGGGKVWPTLNQGGSGVLTIQQSNTFANITNTVQPATVTLTSGTTQTVSTFGVSGTSGNLITLNSSSAGSQATLSDSSSVNSVSFVAIKDINATGGSIWDAPTTAGNVDAGNNLGWNFGIPFNYDIEFSPALRSFTERKQF